MTIKESVSELRSLRDELMKINFGYPLGDNSVYPLTGVDRSSIVLERIANTTAKEQLMALYAECDGFSFPDVHVGYFIKPSAKLDSFDRSSEPDTLILDDIHSVLPVGSTGGGSLFVVDCETGQVMLLPPGLLHNGQYNGRGLNVREVANSVEKFLERLVSDVRAFVNDMEHSYLV